jgi:hypothetical protein
VDRVTSQVVPNVRRRGSLYHFAATSSFAAEVWVAGFSEANGTLDFTAVFSRALNKHPRPARPGFPRNNNDIAIME